MQDNNDRNVSLISAIFFREENSGGIEMNNTQNKIVELNSEERTLIVEKKATCPFIGATVAQSQLPVRNDKQNPLAAIEDVRELGNTGGGDLGEVLVLFAN